jgi:hypothetical protein
MASLVNGWRGWLLGIMATIVGSLIINGIAFQRDTRATLAQYSEQMKRNAERADNILKYLEQRVAERTANTEKEFTTRDRRMDKIVEALDSLYSRVTEHDRAREAELERLRNRIEELEKRR